jgi:hypothetical protein
MRCLVSTTIPQLPNPDVQDVRPGDEDPATQVKEWLQDYATSRDPGYASRSSWPT